MNTNLHLTRLGAAGAFLGGLVFLVSTLLHPVESDPNDPTAAFAEYAADPLWIWSHLGQFLGVVLLGVALVALAATLEAGRPAAWGRLGITGTAALIAAAAALQAVDGVALKVMVDRWAAAAEADRAAVFEAAFAVRQVEIGLASFFSLLIGLTAAAFSLGMIFSRRYPAWLGYFGLVGAVISLAGGVAQASTGFSGLAMTLGMAAGVLLVFWFFLIGGFMWRIPNQLDTD
jgi:hypothetical protein